MSPLQHARADNIRLVRDICTIRKAGVRAVDDVGLEHNVGYAR